MNIAVKGNQVQFSGVPQNGVFASRGKVESILKEIGDKYKTNVKLAMVVNGLNLFKDPEFVRATVDAYALKNFNVVRKLWNFAENTPALVKYPSSIGMTTTDESGCRARWAEREDKVGIFAGSFYEYVWYAMDHADQK